MVGGELRRRLWFRGYVAVSGKDVNGGFDQRVADVVVEQAARHFFKLLVADDFGIFRSDFVAHGRYGIEVKVDGLEFGCPVRKGR
jgi:hypothetical protein